MAYENLYDTWKFQWHIWKFLYTYENFNDTYENFNDTWKFLTCENSMTWKFQWHMKISDTYENSMTHMKISITHMKILMIHMKISMAQFYEISHWISTALHYCMCIELSSTAHILAGRTVTRRAVTSAGLKVYRLKKVDATRIPTKTEYSCKGLWRHMAWKV